MTGVQTCALPILQADFETVNRHAVAVARAVLDDPNWGHHAAVALGQPEGLPVQYERAGAGYWPGYATARAAFA